METAKILPNDIEAEKAVIGSMLIDNDSVVNAIDILKTEDFYRNDNKYIYEAILNLYNRGEPIDLITVKNELITMKKFEAVGGIELPPSEWETDDGSGQVRPGDPFPQQSGYGPADYRHLGRY